MKKLLTLEPAAVGATIAAVYAAAITVYRAATGKGVLEPDLIVAAATAVWGLYTRLKVTPVAKTKP